MADRIAEFAHLGYSDFTIDDVMKDLGCDSDHVKSLIVEATAEMLNGRNDIRSVRVNDLCISPEPEITVEAEEMTEEVDMGMTM